MLTDVLKRLVIVTLCAVRRVPEAVRPGTGHVTAFRNITFCVLQRFVSDTGQFAGALAGDPFCAMGEAVGADPSGRVMVRQATFSSGSCSTLPVPTR